MSIKDLHKEYIASNVIWKRCRDVMEGEDAVKGAGEAYLPRLGGQKDDEYDSYKDRGRLYNAFSKTVSGFVGLTTRKPLITEKPDSFEWIEENIDRQGTNLAGYVKGVIEEILTVGRLGTLVDFNKKEEGATLQDSLGDRPYFVKYKAEEILDWEYKEGILIYIMLLENLSARSAKKEGIKEGKRFRQCEIIDGVYTQTVIVEDENGGEITKGTVTPLMNNKKMDFIPFVMHQVNFDQRVKKPPLIDLVNLVISHYRLKADHAHALHYVALPTPWVSGMSATDENAPKTIGPQKIWYLTNTESKVGLLEFTGNGVKAIQDELKSMEDQMAVLGSRVLLPELSENTATASVLRSMSETSDLASIVMVIEIQINLLLDWAGNWAGVADQVQTSIPRNFLPKEMDGQMITALIAAWQNTAIDYDTLVDNFKKAEIVDSEKDADEMKESAEKDEEDRAVKVAKAISELENNGAEEDDNNE